MNNLNALKIHLSKSINYSGLLNCNNVDGAANELNHHLCDDYKRFCLLNAIVNIYLVLQKNY